MTRRAELEGDTIGRDATGRLRLLATVAACVIVGAAALWPRSIATSSAPSAASTREAVAAETSGPTARTLPLTPPVVAGPVMSPGGTELYGYVPYWLMTPTMATYLASVPLSTLELFSVTATADGSLDHQPLGYRRITGAIGTRLIADAHARGQRVELVFSSFGFARNAALFQTAPFMRPDPRWGGDIDQGTAAGSNTATALLSRQLVALAVMLGVDGIDLDVEDIDSAAYEGFAGFAADLRARLRAALPDSTLSAATTANPHGADLASVAVSSGVDRIFLMGYDLHWSGSEPGGSAPIDRLDGGPSLSSAIAAYATAGVPPERVILGLPLFGMAWPTATADRYAPSLGKGLAWLPQKHVALLTAPGFVPHLDPLETTEFLSEPSGSGWNAIFYDSPRTIDSKLALARASGFAGAGFWAIGYERGVPGYLPVMRDFVAGRIAPTPPPVLVDPGVCRAACWRTSLSTSN